MKFLVDAQLPRRLALRLREAGLDAVHTLDLPLANRTEDSEINEISLREQRVVITKDADFVNSYLVHRRPWKLLLISTGNIGNSELIGLLFASLETIVVGFDASDYIEVGRETIIFHG